MLIHDALPEELSATLAKLGDQWCSTLKRYETAYHSTDSIHWYIEQTNVGALATAVWMCGGVALEEYPTTKEKSASYRGRADLFFELDHVKAVCEAKMKWLKFTKRTDPTADVVESVGKIIDRARRDGRAHQTPHRKFWVAFVCPYWKHGQDGLPSQPEIESLVEQALGTRDLCASFRHRTEADLVSSAGNTCNLAYMVIGPC